MSLPFLTCVPGKRNGTGVAKCPIVAECPLVQSVRKTRFFPLQNVRVAEWSLQIGQILVLLDYVGRAHEIELRPSVRPSVASIISQVTAWISFKF